MRFGVQGIRFGMVAATLFAAASPSYAGEHFTLRNGFEMDCARHEQVGDRYRCFVGADAANYQDLDAASVVRMEIVPDAPAVAVAAAVPVVTAAAAMMLQPTAAELHELLARAGAQHNVDAELLASVVHAESGGQVRAVSRTGAQGLMQLMPGTATAMGVVNAFAAEQNVEGGTRYLDQMLTRYHDNISLALAAYNAGPGAVDRYRGIPPFRETRAYVARVIREFNRRKTTLLAQAK